MHGKKEVRGFRWISLVCFFGFGHSYLHIPKKIFPTVRAGKQHIMKVKYLMICRVCGKQKIQVRQLTE
jgi:hypothetical protein